MKMPYWHFFLFTSIFNNFVLIFMFFTILFEKFAVMLSFHLKCQLLFNYFIVQTVRKMCQQAMLKNAKDVELLPKRRAGLCDSGRKLQDKMFTKD